MEDNTSEMVQQESGFSGDLSDHINGSLEPTPPALVHALLWLAGLSVWVIVVASLAAPHSVGRSIIYCAFTYPPIGVVALLVSIAAGFVVRYRQVKSTIVEKQGDWLAIGIGVVVRRWSRLHLKDIHHIETFRNPIDRLFVVTSIKLHTRGSSHHQAIIRGLPDNLVDRFKRWLDEHQERL